MSDAGLPTTDKQVARMRRARDSVAILKYRLVMLRNSSPDIPILAFEGLEDKTVYYIWIQRLRDLSYEPFPCFGKEKVLEFFKMLLRDLGDLDRGVYFFVDRDFDDLAGTQDDPRIFMTDRYSIENYLVEERVLDEILKNELQCHANAEVRRVIVEKFSARYAEFLKVTKELNFRLFAAKTNGITLQGPLPDSVGDIAEITLEKISPTRRSPEKLITLKRELTHEEERSTREEFSRLDPRKRYRGKFCLMFFERWLKYLVAEYALHNSQYFLGLVRDAKAKQSEITIAGFANKSEVPDGLKAFVENIR